MRWVLTPFLRYADFRGRSGRAEFWTFFGVSVAVFVVVLLMTGLSTETANTSKLPQPTPSSANASPVGAIIYLIWWLASIVPWIAVQVRRFHDQGRSGWLALIGIGGYVAAGFGSMPLAALLVIASLILMALPGDAEGNTDVAADADGPDTEFTAIPTEQEVAVASNGNDAGIKIVEGQDGLHYVKGRAFSSLVEAERAARRLTGERQNFIPQSFGHAVLEPEEQAKNDSGPVELTPQRATPADLPSDVISVGNGRYECRGYTFNSLSAAVSYSQRRSAPVPALKNANSSELHDNRPRVSSLGISQAQREIPSHQFRPSEASYAVPDGGGVRNDKHGGYDTTGNAIPSYLPPDVKPEGDGRFSCGGYTNAR